MVLRADVLAGGHRRGPMPRRTGKETGKDRPTDRPAS